MILPPSPELISADAPDLHLANAVFSDDALGGMLGIVRFLQLRQLSAFRFLDW